MNYVLKFVFAGIILLVMACSARKSETNQQADNPQTPEQFVEQASFTTLDGDSVHISDYKGKVVLIDFWETWCKPCLASFPGLDSLKNEYPENFEVLAVTPGFTDTKENAREFAENHDYDFTYLLDSFGLHKKLDVMGIPYKVYVGADGKFIKSSLGSSGSAGDYQKIKKIIEEHKKSVGSGQ